MVGRFLDRPVTFLLGLELSFLPDVDRAAGADSVVPPRFHRRHAIGARCMTPAHISFEAEETHDEPIRLTIQSQAADDAPTFTSSSGYVSARPRNATPVSWSPPAWITAGAYPGPVTPSLARAALIRRQPTSRPR